jgi:hypothetical protein
MKNIFSITVVTLLLIACDSPLFSKKDKLPPGVQIVREYYPNRKIKSVLRVKENKRHGLCKYYYQDGSLRAEYHYRYNRLHGTCTDYYKNGEIKLVGHYVNNKLNGLMTSYYKSGSMMYEAEYVDGKKHGVKKRYYENGKLMSTNNYYLGKAGKGLKEYTSDGKRITNYPEIEIKEVNRLAMEGTLYLKISLSNNSSNVTFYITELNNEKYLPSHAEPIEKEGNIATVEYYVAKGSVLMKEINVVARYKTKLGNFYLISRKYPIAAKN